jgi:subtilisin family serine protease
VSLEDGSVDDLKSLENVANVWPVRKFGRPTAVIQSLPGRSEVEIRRRQSSNDNITFELPHITDDIKPNNPHKMAGVDKAHALGYSSAGVKIGAVDTGVDYLHPSLGGCFGEYCKISFDYDFVGGTPDPLVQCLEGGHGTHVMGK